MLGPFQRAVLLALPWSADAYLAPVPPPTSPHTLMRASHPAMLAAREAESRLIAVGRRALLHNNVQDAESCYRAATSIFGSPQGYLVLALLLAKQGDFEEARSTFSSGVLAHRTNAGLLQAWGLFESKYGAQRRALMLLRRAVQLDPSKAPVLRWRRFREPVMDARVAEAASEPRAPSEADLFGVRTPPVKFTVRQSNLGWRGREERGEDASKWYDAEGERQGPPQNYWRQRMDERKHEASIQAVLQLLEENGPEESATKELEYRMGITRPELNRQLLGRWAPLMTRGRVVARRACSSPEPPSEDATSGPIHELLVPWTLTVTRAGDRRTVEHRYGTFDAHLEEGEELSFVVARGNAGSQLCQFSVAAAADARVPMEGAPFAFGGISFLNEYLLVQRNEEGALTEAFIRVADNV
jgi:tetratricopeptide (TPR) repeat protein